MAKKRKQQKDDEVLVDIVEVRDQAQDFLEDNQKILFGVLVALVVVAAGLIFWNFNKKQRNATAVEQMVEAQRKFEQDSFATALSMPGAGFLDIIDNYGGTKTGNLAHYYAGICYLNLGKFEAAASYLEDFKGSGNVSPIMKWGVLGDTYSELQEWSKAENAYKKATTIEQNELLTPYYLRKLGLFYENQGNQAQALKQYERIKEEFPQSPQGVSIEKYIQRVQQG